MDPEAFLRDLERKPAALRELAAALDDGIAWPLHRRVDRVVIKFEIGPDENALNRHAINTRPQTKLIRSVDLPHRSRATVARFMAAA